MISRWRSRIPHIGEYMVTDENVIANNSKKTIKLNVSNTGDRPIQVGSHTHFAEANKALEFDREKALGFHLNIPSGTSIPYSASTACGSERNRCFNASSFQQAAINVFILFVSSVMSVSFFCLSN